MKTNVELLKEEVRNKIDSFGENVLPYIDEAKDWNSLEEIYRNFKLLREFK